MDTDKSRRNFLRTMIGGVAAGAAVRTWPFRVFSFPSEIAQPPMRILIWKSFGATSGNHCIDPTGLKPPGYYGVWDWEMVSQHEALKPQTLFNIP